MMSPHKGLSNSEVTTLNVKKSKQIHDIFIFHENHNTNFGFWYFSIKIQFHETAFMDDTFGKF